MIDDDNMGERERLSAMFRICILSLVCVFALWVLWLHSALNQ